MIERVVLTDTTALSQAIAAGVGGGGGRVVLCCGDETDAAGSGSGKQVSVFKSIARQHVSFSLWKCCRALDRECVNRIGWLSIGIINKRSQFAGIATFLTIYGKVVCHSEKFCINFTIYSHSQQKN